MLAKALQGSTAAAPTYVDDVFSTYLYTGNGSTQTITNGINLAGLGGLVWVKGRSNADDHTLVDTARGTNKVLVTGGFSATSGQTTVNGTVTAFNASGFSIGNNSNVNGSGKTFASWTFRKAPKFFDVVTYTGDGVAGRTVAHSLGQTPGMVVVKCTSADLGDWAVWHRSTGDNVSLALNGTGASTANTGWVRSADASTFTLGNSSPVNSNGGTYVAYLFAHDTAADGLIQCGSYSGTGAAQNITLGWEPQFVIIKRASGGTGDWNMVDSMRGFVVGGGDAWLRANTSSAESSADLFDPTATGFNMTAISAEFNASGSTYVYIAIRRPNKPPTSGTQVFQPTVYTGTNVDNRLVDTTIAPDMVWVRQRNDTVLGGMVVGDRLRGQPYLLTGTTAAEVNTADAFDQQIVSTTEYGTAFSAMNGFWCGNDATAKLNANTTSNNHIAEAFKRAQGFFDVVCYTGTGSGGTVSHNLGVVPEMVIVKCRNTTGNWEVSVFPASVNYAMTLDRTFAAGGTPPASAVSATTFTTTGVSGTSGNTYVAYLFASVPGVSKVGSYTGNGSNQTINCGFSAGARFVLIKRTDSTGDWYVWDTARGIVSGNDPHLSLNSTAAEVTTNDSIDPDNSGFVVNQLAATNINVNSATYIFLAVA